MICSYLLHLCDIILIFKLHKRTRFMPCSSIHSLKIQMTSHPCNKYEHTTLSYLLSVKVGDYSLKIHKSGYHLFLVFISKPGFSSLQTSKSFGEILSRNHHFLGPIIRLLMPYNCAYFITTFTFLCNKSIAFRLPDCFLLTMGLLYHCPLGPIMSDIINA